MRFLLVPVMLATAVFAHVDRFSARWAREDARIAQREAQRSRTEDRRYAAESRRKVMRDRVQTRRQSLRYGNELRRQLRNNRRMDRPDTTGMKRIL